MSKKGMEKGLHHESYGFRDSGIALIVSISIIILLLLLVSLESAVANPGVVEEEAVAGGATRQGAEKDPATVHLKTAPHQGRSHEKILGGAAETVSPSEMLMILGLILLLMALMLSRDRKEE
jgi:hypothetical protein